MRADRGSSVHDSTAQTILVLYFGADRLYRTVTQVRGARTYDFCTACSMTEQVILLLSHVYCGHVVFRLRLTR